MTGIQATTSNNPLWLEKPTVEKRKITEKSSSTNKTQSNSRQYMYICIQRELLANNLWVLLQLVCTNITTAKQQPRAKLNIQGILGCAENMGLHNQKILF